MFKDQSRILSFILMAFICLIRRWNAYCKHKFAAGHCWNFKNKKQKSQRMLIKEADKTEFR